MALLIYIAVPVLVVLAIGLAYDMRSRRRGRAIRGGGETGTAAHQAKLDSQFRSTKWGAGGG
jgi:hypothetical protein